MKKAAILTPIGDGIENLFIAIKEVHIDKLILVATEKNLQDVAKLKAELAKFRYDISEKIVKHLNYETFVSVAAEWQEIYPDLYINIATGSPVVQHAAIVASLINGIPSVAASDGKAVMLPVMRLTYYKNVSSKKMQILKTLRSNRIMKLVDISRRSNMSLPLVSYHINGTMKCEGLRQMGLVDFTGHEVSVTALGELMLRGYMAN